MNVVEQYEIGLKMDPDTGCMIMEIRQPEKEPVIRMWLPIAIALRFQKMVDECCRQLEVSLIQRQQVPNESPELD